MEQIAAHLLAHLAQYLIVSLVLGAVAVVLALVLWLRLRSIERPFKQIQSDGGEAPELLQAIVRATERAEDSVMDLDSRLAAHVRMSRSFVKHIGLVRYDAFEGVAGKQSFSLCLLNELRDGVLITYLSNKSATRSYAVTVEKGRPSRELSEEETGAMSGALSEEKVTVPG